MKIFIHRYPVKENELTGIGDEIVFITIDRNKNLINGKQNITALFTKDFSLPTLIRLCRELCLKYDIESINTICEEDMQWVGFLNDYFFRQDSKFFENTIFRDKYVMRSVLDGIVPQPQFSLIESLEDIHNFIRNCTIDKFIIKPRFGAASVGILTFTRSESATFDFSSYISGSFIIEEMTDMKFMVTADGYSKKGEIKRYFNHEYSVLELDAKDNKKNQYVRTSKLYNKNLRSIQEKIFEESKKILQVVSFNEEITPFHFEWFYSPETQEILFCEVGRRFGGGEIPRLIKNAFDVDILEEYWRISSKKVSIDNMITLNYTNILSPLKISAAYFSVKKEGKLVSKPDRSKFSFTDMTWRFSKIGDIKEGKLESVAESDFLSIITAENESDFIDKIKILDNISEDYKYVKI